MVFSCSCQIRVLKHEWEYFSFYGSSADFCFIYSSPPPPFGSIFPFFFRAHFSPRRFSSVRACKQIKFNDFYGADGWRDGWWWEGGGGWGKARQIIATNKESGSWKALFREKCVRSDYCYYILRSWCLFVQLPRQIVFTAAAPNKKERSLFTHFPIANNESFSSALSSPPCLTPRCDVRTYFQP